MDAPAPFAMQPAPPEGLVTLTHALHGLPNFSALLYRIIRGWIALSNRKAMPLPQ